MTRFCIFFVIIFCFPFRLFSVEGIQYKHDIVPDSYAPFPIIHSHSIHIVEIDSSYFEIKPVKALDNGVGRESVSSLAERHSALAAINAGFFQIGGILDGKPSGALKINTWRSLPDPFKPRGCIGWSQQRQEPIMDRLLVTAFLDTPKGRVSVSGLNRIRRAGEMILFTPEFHNTTLTLPTGQELIIVNGVVEAIVLGGSTKIPENGYVLSIDKKSPFFDAFYQGDKVTFFEDVEPLMGFSLKEDWDHLDYILGGVPLLIKDNVKIKDFSEENITIPTFISQRKARTAIGLLSSGHWILVVVDKIDEWGGMTLEEFSDYLLNLNCTDILNLDGGGSSTLFFDGEIKNTPMGDEDEDQGEKKVRRVSDAIVVVPKKS